MTEKRKSQNASTYYFIICGKTKEGVATPPNPPSGSTPVLTAASHAEMPETYIGEMDECEERILIASKVMNRGSSMVL